MDDPEVSKSCRNTAGGPEDNALATVDAPRADDGTFADALDPNALSTAAMSLSTSQSALK